jgi:hypothetical protein
VHGGIGPGTHRLSDWVLMSDVLGAHPLFLILRAARKDTRGLNRKRIEDAVH